MKTLLFLDDLRNPFLDLESKVPEILEDFKIIWVRSYTEFRLWIETYGLPDHISFDHDLAPEHYTPEFFWNDYNLSSRYQAWREKFYQEGTGNDCAIFLVDYIKEHGLEMPIIHIHSANPVGANKIKKTINESL